MTNADRIYLTRDQYIKLIDDAISRTQLDDVHAYALRKHAKHATLVSRRSFVRKLRSGFCGCPATQAGLWGLYFTSVSPEVIYFAHEFDDLSTHYINDPDVDHRDVTLVEIVND